ncbi:hypothetical protein [Methanosarcina mazei]|uniref:Uncharacterized protein n=1 Tax=Methanosarcina mazei WWM610 TaxID=1434117 RepID=A0A0E3PYF7_METMZ|nr:hypothetical protein [Methanosarcina mazei]AKB40874.1 hypothetical protein MSMAW_1883 [Methanosarcina mazei WWM610]
MVVKTKSVKKVSARKSVKSSAKKAVYKVTASYTGKFETSSAAKAAAMKVKQSGKAQVSPIKKVGKMYGFSVKFAFITPSASVRDQAIKVAKARGAKVTVSTVRV